MCLCWRNLTETKPEKSNKSSESRRILRIMTIRTGSKVWQELHVMPCCDMWCPVWKLTHNLKNDPMMFS